MDHAQHITNSVNHDSHRRAAQRDLPSKICSVSRSTENISQATSLQNNSSRPLLIEAYGTDVPLAFLRAAESAASNPYCCLVHTRAFQPELIPTLQHIVVSSADRLLIVLSYYRRGSTLFIVNQLIDLSDAVLERCARALFALHTDLHRIQLELLYDDDTRNLRSRGIPMRTWRSIEDMVLCLPDTFEQYLNGFGTKTRKNLRYCAKRLKRENPAAEFVIAENQAIDESVVAGLVHLHHLRMSTKGRRSGIDPLYTEALVRLSKHCGVACVARDGDRILGGTLCTRIGSGWSLQVIAHDPQFNHVRLGLLCLLKSIETAIGADATSFHFLWGPADYKTLFGATERPLLARRYYRSKFRRLLAVDDYRQQLAQFARRSVRALRSISLKREDERA
jgi:hypothetical protein